MPNEVTPHPDVRMPDLDWFLQNFDEVVRQYEGEWVGIQDGRVVVHDRDPQVFGRRVRELGLPRLYITRAHPEAWRTYK